MNQTIGSLRVSLGLDSAQFNAGLKQAQANLERIAGKMRSIGAAVSAVGAGIALAVKGQLDAADEMGELAEKLGVPVESLSALKHAAKILGVEFGTLQGGLLRLSRGMANTPEKFKRLGIAVQDANGDLRPTADVLKDLADRFQSMPDGAEKTALAIELFGKAGADLIPALNAGSAGINSLMEEAKALGLVITEDTAKAAGKFNENLDKLGGAATGLATIVAAQLAPILEKISDFLVSVAQAFQNLSPETQKFLGILGGVAVVLGPALIGFSLMLPALTLLVSPLGLVAAGIAALGAAAVLAPDALDKVSVALTGMPLEEQKNAWQKFGDDLVVIADNLPTALGIIFKRLAAAILPGIQSFGQAVRNGAIAAYNWFKGEISEIGTYLSGLAAEFYQYGVNLVQGLIDGVKSKAAEFKQYWSDFGSDIGTIFRYYTGIQSPSKVMMENGQFLMQGLQLGIEGGAPAAVGAMQTVAENMTSTMETMSGKMKGLADGLATGLTNIFTKIVSRAKVTLQDVGQIVSQIANTLFIQPFTSGLQEGLKGLLGGFAGGFATGGFIPPGQWGITGESGPEIVSGGRSGATVTPMSAGGQVSQVFNITAPDPNAFRYSQRQIQRRARSALGGV